MERRPLILRHAWIATAALLLSPGCMYLRGPSPPATDPFSASTPPSKYPTTASTAGNNPSNSAAATPAELAAVMASVQDLGAVDPVAQNALLEDLKKTDPSLWPQLVQTFRSSVAYHKQTQERDRLAAIQSGQMQQAGLAQAPEPIGPNVIPAQAVATQPPTYSDPAAASYRTLQPLPESMSPAVAPKSIPAEFAASYPNTRMPEVHLCSAEQTIPSDWHDQLAATIKTLESGTTISNASNAPVNPAEQATLRMLYLAAGRRDDALRSAPGLATTDQEFWNEELSGLAAALDACRPTDANQRAVQAADAADHLRTAAGKLGQSATLVVRNPAFCTEVLSYGIYKPFPKYEFKPGQEAVLYAEVDNFVSQPADRGNHTALKSKYQIVDSRGVRVAQQEYPVTEEWCKNPRRDYFVRYFLYMPSRIASGNYTLELTVEDTLGNKQSQSNVPFTIVGTEPTP